MVCFGECGSAEDWIEPGEIPFHSWFAYLTVDDVKALHDQFKERGVEIVGEYKETQTGYGCSFTIRTIDGHRINNIWQW